MTQSQPCVPAPPEKRQVKISVLIDEDVYAALKAAALQNQYESWEEFMNDLLKESLL